VYSELGMMMEAGLAYDTETGSLKMWKSFDIQED
jgi:hypothetical protein